MDIRSIMTNLSCKRPVFHNEADFQHALAWEIREHYPQAKIRLEKKVRGSAANMYLDIFVDCAGRRYGIELKYKTRRFEGAVEGEEFTLNNQGAHDIGRYDVMKDLQRLEQMVAAGVVDEGILVFLTNDPLYYTDLGEEKLTADRDFRLHEGRNVQGRLSWGEQAGPGTMRGREEPISLHGQYEMKWAPYSQMGGSNGGAFHFLMLAVQDVQAMPSESHSISPDVAVTPKQEADTIAVQQVPPGTNDEITWFASFRQRGGVFASQADLRDHVAAHLRGIGYSVQVNRQLGKDKIDIWAEKDRDVIAIEVRYKTASLQTIYQGKHVHLKDQWAHDISRYDFVADLAKLERVVNRRPDVKGYALLLTNDRNYWNPPKKHNPVDEDFRIHDGRVVAGLCSWKAHAGTGTTSGREEPIHLTGTYRMRWQPYLTLEAKKNGEFQALLIEVKQR